MDDNYPEIISSRTSVGIDFQSCFGLIIEYIIYYLENLFTNSSLSNLTSSSTRTIHDYDNVYTYFRNSDIFFFSYRSNSYT